MLAGGHGKVLVLEGSFSDLDPGNQALRYFGGGLGGGRAKVQVETEIKDPVTKRVLFRASDRRIHTGAWSVLGGGSQGLILECLNEVAEGHAKFIKRVATDEKK